MAFSEPSLEDIVGRIEADLEAELPGLDARTRRSVLAALARALGGAVDGLYGYMGWISRQILVDSAEADGLERHARIWGVTRLAAAYAQGPVALTAQAATSAPAGTRLSRADGQEYELTAPVDFIGAATLWGTARALAPGVAGNTPLGTPLALVSPVAAIAAPAEVASPGLAGGADAEADDALRARIIARIQSPPHGGNALDYVAWAREIPGVGRAWCQPLANGPGTVTVRFMMDAVYADGLPRPADVAAVAAYIGARRPVTAQVTVAAPSAQVFNARITNLAPDTQAVRDAVAAAVRDWIVREGQPGGTLLISHLREEISAAAGETNHVLASPVADVTHAPGVIPVMGTIQWT